MGLGNLERAIPELHLVGLHAVLLKSRGRFRRGNFQFLTLIQMGAGQAIEILDGFDRGAVFARDIPQRVAALYHVVSGHLGWCAIHLGRLRGGGIPRSGYLQPFAGTDEMGAAKVIGALNSTDAGAVAARDRRERFPGADPVVDIGRLGQRCCANGFDLGQQLLTRSDRDFQVVGGGG